MPLTAPRTSPGLGHRGDHLGVVADPEGTEVAGDDALGPRAEDRLQAEVGQALGDEALRRADEEDGLLHPPSAADESDLLTAVLGVVPGIGLVGDEVGQRDRQDGQVGVHRHPRVEIPQVVVEARPRLVGDELEVDAFAFG